MELTTFEGNDMLGWTARAGNFFEVKNASQKEKLYLALICMEGDNNYWFKFWPQKSRNPSWEDFTTALNRRFEGRERNTVFELVINLFSLLCLPPVIYQPLPWPMALGFHPMVLVLFIFFLLDLLTMFFMFMGLSLTYYPLVV